MAQVLPLVSTSFTVLSAILMAFGWRLIRLGRREAHQRMMLAAAFSALMFFILYVTRTVVYGSMPFGGPEHLRVYYLVFLLIHIVFATVSAVLGIVTITLGLKGRFVRHRWFGRTTASIWFITAVTAVITYVLLYVLYPADNTTNLWNAIF